MLINKDLVKYRFSKSLNSYDNTAVVQKEMATLLIDKILTNCGKNFNKVFEFGVGTGFLSKNILDKITFEEYYANDIIEESEFCIKNIIDNAKFLAGDIEKIELNHKFDLVVSNAVMQWITDVDELLFKIKNCTTQNGFFAFTTFGEQNYKEIKETTGVSLNYLKSETLKEKCEKYFEIISYDENVQTLYFDTPLDVLKHIKQSGTNGIAATHWTVSKLKEFEKFYKENFSVANKVILTYNPVYVILKLK